MAATCSLKIAGPVVSSRHLVDRVRSLRERVTLAQQRGTLFFYLLFLRMFPISPNWLLNMVSGWVRTGNCVGQIGGSASGLACCSKLATTMEDLRCFISALLLQVGVPLPYFAMSMALGLAPYNFVTVNAGSILEQVSGWNVCHDRSWWSCRSWHR